MKADAVLNLRIPAEVKDALVEAAEQNLRSMSSMAVWALAQWLAENGFLERGGSRGASRASKRRRT